MTDNIRLNHHQRYLMEEFAEEHLAHRLGRRDLLRRALLVTGRVPLAATTLALGCGDDAGDDPAATATTAPAPVGTPVGPGIAANDPLIEAQDVSYPGQAGNVLGYIARPKAGGTYPGVIVIHENQGLLDHFKDVSRRYAREGFAALAVDLASRRGGTAVAGMAFAQTPTEELVADLLSSVDYLKRQTFVKPAALGVSGFCFGGNFAFELAIANQDMKAAVPYYGTVSAANLDKLGQTRAAVLAIYGATDNRVTPQSTEVEQRLKTAGKTVEIKIYDGAGHAFFNEGRANSYNEAASKDAWAQTLAWFRMHLTG